MPRVRSLLLRAVRRGLRALDRRLAGAPAAPAAPPAVNGRREQLAALLDSQVQEPGAESYWQEHRERILATLSYVPVGPEFQRALEVGSYLQMASALRLVLGYESVAAAYYAGEPGQSTKSVQFHGRPALTLTVDEFDVERHRFPYPDGSFDLVLLCEVLEHFTRDPFRALLECHRVLRTGGILLVTTPNTTSLSSVARALEGRENPQVFSRYHGAGLDSPHVREYTPHELRELVTQAGFAVTAFATARAPHSGGDVWVADLLASIGRPTEERGEQMYCLARALPVDGERQRPAWLYSGG